MTIPRSLPVAALLFPLLSLAAGCKQGAVETNAAAAETAPIAVTLVPAREIQVPRVLTLSGTLIGAEQAKVAAGATGKVVATYVERGSVVRKGAVLARLDARAPAAQAQEAVAQWESMKVQQAQAQLDCERNQRMFDKGAISKADYDRARTQCEATKWSVSAADARKTMTAEALKDTEIRAPFNGMVVERAVTAGEYLRPDSAVATLVDVDSLRVELTVPEGDVTLVKQGQPIEFKLASDESGAVYHGRIRYIGPAVRQQTRDAVVEAMVDNDKHALRPGMFVTAQIALGERTLPGVPEKGIRADGAQRHVFVNVGGRLEDRLVQVDGSRDGLVAVVNGVKAGEQVVAPLTPDVRDGAKVK